MRRKTRSLRTLCATLAVTPVVRIHFSESRLPEAARCVFDRLRRLMAGNGAHYIAKLFLPWLLESNATLGNHRLLVLDHDVWVRSSLTALAGAELGDAAVGLVLEGSLSMASTMGVPRAFNGGVQLLDLPRMRASQSYVAMLEEMGDADFECAEVIRLGRFGDQTVYSLMAKRDERLVASLPCGWNRQLGAWQFDLNRGMIGSKGTVAFAERCDSSATRATCCTSTCWP